MENHPIPQDVTGFQFKLIGNMTVRQFAYLATGIVLGWVFLQLQVSIFIKFPLSLFFVIFGIGLAFLPISGRPMDAMIESFIKALLRPTQFVYKKTGGQLYFSTAKNPFKGTVPFLQKDKLKTYLASQAIQNNKIDEKESNFLASVANLAVSHPTTPDINPALNTPGINPPKPAPAPKALSDLPLIKPAAQPHVEKTQKIPIAKEETKPMTPFPKSFKKNVELLNAPSSPNLITGVTKDARGNPLSNILVEVKDKEGNPVRAFKTNELGRFASATPLLNGSYSVELEDPKSQNKFQNGIINVTGQIIQPLVITSIDTREELRRSLFSANN